MKGDEPFMLSQIESCSCLGSRWATAARLLSSNDPAHQIRNINLIISVLVALSEVLLGLRSKCRWQK